MTDREMAYQLRRHYENASDSLAQLYANVGYALSGKRSESITGDLSVLNSAVKRTSGVVDDLIRQCVEDINKTVIKEEQNDK